MNMAGQGLAKDYYKPLDISVSSIVPPPDLVVAEDGERSVRAGNKISPLKLDFSIDTWVWWIKTANLTMSIGDMSSVRDSLYIITH